MGWIPGIGDKIKTDGLAAQGWIERVDDNDRRAAAREAEAKGNKDASDAGAK